MPNALQTGVADGYLNPAFVPLLFGHTDFIKFYTDAAVPVAFGLILLHMIAGLLMRLNGLDQAEDLHRKEMVE